mgnify:CR=1 FL=1
MNGNRFEKVIRAQSPFLLPLGEGRDEGEKQNRSLSPHDPLPLGKQEAFAALLKTDEK